jgi:ankyrin repeat protein
MKTFSLYVAVLLACCPVLMAGSAAEALLAAAAASDAEKLVLALAEAKPDVRDKDGRTALMLAAEAGSFECAKRLLWAGADARLKDDSGKSALDLVDADSPSHGPLTLLLRCHAFCRENARPGGKKARIPHLALVNDMYVDYSHPALVGCYAVNTAELKGKKDVDDDRNGFVDDVYGWNLNNDQPVRTPMLSIDGTKDNKDLLVPMMNDYLKVTNGGDEELMKRMQNRY